jgi:hypothetical protein
MAANLPVLLEEALWKDGTAAEAVDKAVPVGAGVLLLVSPFLTERGSLNGNALWKRYLAQHCPQTKLIVVGFKKKSGINYLDVFDLPENLSHFFETAQPAGADWQPVDAGGAEMQQELRTFFLGHGNESIAEAVSDVFKYCSLIDPADAAGYVLIKTEFLDANDVPQKWAGLQRRWAKYEWLFPYTPFYHLMQEIAAKISYISPYFDNKCTDREQFAKLEVNKHLFELTFLINKVGKYVL